MDTRSPKNPLWNRLEVWSPCNLPHLASFPCTRFWLCSPNGKSDNLQCSLYLPKCYKLRYFRKNNTISRGKQLFQSWRRKSRQNVVLDFPHFNVETWSYLGNIKHCSSMLDVHDLHIVLQDHLEFLEWPRKNRLSIRQIECFPERTILRIESWRANWVVGLERTWNSWDVLEPLQKDREWDYCPMICFYVWS